MTFSAAELADLDAADSLASFRAAFDLPEGVIYLAGNSLGAPPRTAAPRLAEVVREEWGRSLVRAWTAHDWIDAPLRVGGKIAGLIGAKRHEVAVADSTSVNLYKLALGTMRARPGRMILLTAEGDFPTDAYVAEGVVAGAGPGARVRRLAREAVLDALDEDTAVLVLVHAHYKTAELFDMAEVTARAHAAGALVVWDLSHSVGAVPVDLNGAGADLAVGCGYKYLNGGPGAPAWLFVAERHHAALASPLSGWMGHARPFDFEERYAPAEGIARFLCGTPPILSLAALEAGVDLMLEADSAQLAAKVRRLGDLFLDLAAERCPALQRICPGPGERRGGHVAFRHPDAYAIMQALIARGVIGDFRAPDVAVADVKRREAETQHVGRAVDVLAEVIDTRAHDRPEHRTRAKVT